MKEFKIPLKHGKLLSKYVRFSIISVHVASGIRFGYGFLGKF